MVRHFVYFKASRLFLPFYLFQLGKFFFPVREVILDVFLNHNAKLRHPELAVGTYRYIGVFKGTFSLKKIFALDLRLSEVVDDDLYLTWIVRLAIALVARYFELIHERFVALDPRLEVFSRSLWRAVGKVKERQLLLGVSSYFKFFHDDFFYLLNSSFASFAPHALKGQKLLAQGSALGYFGRKPVAL